VIATGERKSISTEELPVSRPRAIWAGLVATACFAAMSFAFAKTLIAGDWSVVFGATLLAGLSPLYTWSLYRMFLNATADRRKAKRRTMYVLVGSFALAIVVVVAPALLAGLGAGLGGGSDNDSDGDSDGGSESSRGSGGSGPGFHFGGMDFSGSGRSGSDSGAAHSRPPIGGPCIACGRNWGTGVNGLCMACCMPPRF
jgi:uncharacterized membrane protein YgcG